MKLTKKKWLQRSIAFFAVIVLVITGIPSGIRSVKAAGSPTILQNSMIIGIGTMGTYRGNDSLNNTYSADPYCITLGDLQKGATYSYSSSNTNIVQVKTSGNKGYLTGMAVGSATITCKQKLKGKTKTIGKTKVSVKASSIVMRDNYKEKDITMQIGVGTQEKFRIPFIILNRNNKAKYTYTSNSKNLTISEKFEVVTVNKDYNDIRNSLRINAKKAGNYKVTVKETYNKKTRTLGSFQVTVDNSKYQNILTMTQGESEELRALFETEGTYAGLELLYEGDGFKLTDSGNAVQMVDKKESGRTIHKLIAQKPGMAKINVYSYNPLTKKKGNLIERYLIEVTEAAKIEEKSIHISAHTRDTYVGEKYVQSISWVVRANPLGTLIPYNQVEVTSSDESILQIKALKYSAVEYIPKKAGKATITFRYGKVSNTCEVTVYENQEQLLQSQSWIDKTVPVELNDKLYLDRTWVYPSLNDWYLEGDGFDLLDANSIVNAEKNNTAVLNASKAGIAKINAYEYDNESGTKGKLIGSFTVEVKEAEKEKELIAEDVVLSKYTIETYMTADTNSDTTQDTNKTNYFQWAVFPSMENWNPIDGTGFEVWGNYSGSKKLRDKTSITISDTSILSLKNTVGDDIDDDEGHLYMIPLKSGKTTITFQCDNASATCNVIIYANKAEYQKAVEDRLK